MQQILVKIVSNHRVLNYPEAEYFILRIHAPEIAQHCRPGQFLMVKCGDDTLLRRPISVHSVIGSTDLELLYAVPQMAGKTDLPGTECNRELRTATGKGMHWLSKLRQGFNLSIVGPLGNGFTIKSSTGLVLLIAGGIGIAPLKFLADFALGQQKKVILLLGARTRAAVFPPERLPANINLILTTEDGSMGTKGNIVNLVPEYIDSADQVFACGPLPMYKALAKQLESWHQDKTVDISLELRMGCGTGVCYSCSIKTRQGMQRVCKEGPVFNIKDIIWQEVRL